MGVSGANGFPERRHTRYPLPTTLAPVVAEFRGPAGEVLTGRLWDISAAGACLYLSKTAVVAEDTLGVLSVRLADNLQELSLPVQVCWSSTPSPLTTLLGMVFSEGLLAPGTFLDEYMKGSWTERLELYRSAKVPRFS
ncbi:PilZ domain-containing protein [Cyanobium sp. Morenito 9A2]|uniref:PilZ domain-containing protein n=1 Tax=Cyanobium sp. Morenito 9A2 TaxID=2823718 RepID=UPI0020CD7B35|nr:PilZ domain-containing protein [Cyanobium sp. Morenito 9A2]MCP9850403.1 PilZ domain-containing protein [Cyanobium sp. Morenito 9A2]